MAPRLRDVDVARKQVNKTLSEKMMVVEMGSGIRYKNQATKDPMCGGTKWILIWTYVSRKKESVHLLGMRLSD